MALSFLNPDKTAVKPSYSTTGAPGTPGSESVSYQKIVNPITVLYAAEGAALRGQTSVDGAALSAITLDVGKTEIDCYPGSVSPVTIGGAPTDCNVRVQVKKDKNALGQFIFTPTWVLVGNALNTAITVVAAGALQCDLKFVQR